MPDCQVTTMLSDVVSCHLAPKYASITSMKVSPAMKNKIRLRWMEYDGFVPVTHESYVILPFNLMDQPLRRCKWYWPYLIMEDRPQPYNSSSSLNPRKDPCLAAWHKHSMETHTHTHTDNFTRVDSSHLEVHSLQFCIFLPGFLLIEN